MEGRPVRDTFTALEAELNHSFFERREPIRGLLVGLLARQHVLFLGPPGTAKSALVEDLCSRIGGNYFKWLLGRLTAPEEIFGPVSLKALEQDSYRRKIDGKLPTSTIGFLDEIFKCNSAVLNMLLPILNERQFFNDGQPVQVPLQMMVGASNELPEDREELGALWDRFALRYIVDYIRDPNNFGRFLQAVAGGQAPATHTTITTQDLAGAQAGVKLVRLDAIARHFLLIRDAMADLNLQVSDRRFAQSLSLVQANAWLEGRTAATEEDLGILAHALWQEPSQAVQVRQTLIGLINPLEQKAIELLDQAQEQYHKAIKAPDDKATQAGTEAVAKLKRITTALTELQTNARGQGRSTATIDQGLHQVAAWNSEVIQKCLGIPIS